MADTSQPNPREPLRLTAQAAIAAGELRQLANGRPGFYRGSYGVSSGNQASFWESGQCTIPKATGIVLLDGGEAYWDYSANVITYRKNGDRDFLVGTLVGDAASADTTCTVNVGVFPHFGYDVLRLPAGCSEPIGTQTLPAAGVPGFGYPFRMGHTTVLSLGATNEAQRVDLYSVDTFDPINANAIVEIKFQRMIATSGGAQDFNIGVANGTHATNFDSVTEYLALHLDGSDNHIYAQSTDGTHTVAATDTSASVTTTTPILSALETWWFDMRDITSVKLYRNGVRILSGTTFNLSSAASNWQLIAHLEKTAAAGNHDLIAIYELRARTAEQ